MTAPDDDTVQPPPPDGGTGWLIVFSSCLLLGLISMNTTLQSQSLSLVGRQSTGYNQGQSPSSTPTTSSSPLSTSDPLEVQLSNLFKIYISGDHSVAGNISAILHALNRTSEVEMLLSQAFAESEAGQSNNISQGTGPIFGTVVPGSTVTAVTNAVTNAYSALFALFGE